MQEIIFKFLGMILKQAVIEKDGWVKICSSVKVKSHSSRVDHSLTHSHNAQKKIKPAELTMSKSFLQ